MSIRLTINPEAVDGFPYPGYYLPEDRAKANYNALRGQTKWNKQAINK